MIQPLSDYVLLEFFKEDDTTKAGFIVPDAVKEKKKAADFEPEEGLVVEASKGDKNDKNGYISLEIKKGDKVIFYRYHTKEIEIKNKKYLLIRNSNLVAVIR